ncbi:MAG: cation diffusion facilitator family transporter [Halobacteriaceae archaeon]
MASSKKVVLAALFANGAIALLKFGGWVLTGSPSMLSETYHSVSDTGNQVFLLIGLRYGEKEPSRGHPFGYGKAQFFYAFLVSVFLFGIAGWESVSHGVHALQHPEPVGAGESTLLGVTFPTVYVNYAVLLGAIAFESYAFRAALANMKNQIKRHGWTGMRQAFRRTSNVTVLTALTEDAVALGGAAIALAGIALSKATGDPIYDAVGALLIGLLLMGFALALAWENKRLLLGESVASEDEDLLRDAIASHESVVHVDDLRSVFFGPERLLVTADVSFDSSLVTGDIDGEITAIEEELKAVDDRVKTVYIEPEL